MNLCNFDVLALHDFSSSADIQGNEFSKKDCPSEARTHDLPMSFPNMG